MARKLQCLDQQAMMATNESRDSWP
ncbi:hypothetical protein CCACVL1_15605 [Corchorus capsularis]|uniref:Uncharacterized protein n=1 Tax=Corchorus capsularis TaxID=210143 RepID=A0A1R3I1V9_COCAP|nr:hypothetical protein CCACVL1_15605 [Corchorus capsularis]